MRNLFNKSDWQWIMVCGLITAMCLGENHFEKKMINKQYQYVINNKDSVISHQNNTIDSINVWIDKNYPVQITINPYPLK